MTWSYFREILNPNVAGAVMQQINWTFKILGVGKNGQHMTMILWSQLVVKSWMRGDISLPKKPVSSQRIENTAYSSYGLLRPPPG
jgi:hypothetical protein